MGDGKVFDIELRSSSSHICGDEGDKEESCTRYVGKIRKRGRIVTVAPHALILIIGLGHSQNFIDLIAGTMIFCAVYRIIGLNDNDVYHDTIYS